MSVATFELLKGAVEPLLIAYQEDLYKHDLNTLTGYDGPFVYGYRPTGTDLLLMRAKVEDYAWNRPMTREEIELRLKELFVWIDYQGRNTHFLHYDGKKLHRKSVGEVKTIWFNHISKIVRAVIAYPIIN